MSRAHYEATLWGEGARIRGENSVLSALQETPSLPNEQVGGSIPLTTRSLEEVLQPFGHGISLQNPKLANRARGLPGHVGLREAQLHLGGALTTSQIQAN